MPHAARAAPSRPGARLGGLHGAAVDAQSYGARLGLLGEALPAGGAQVTGIGPGAAIALPTATATRRARTCTGRRARRSLEPRRCARRCATSDLVVVDAGTVRDAGQATVGRTSDAADGALTEQEQAELVAEADDPSSTEAFVEPTRARQTQVVDARVGAVLDAAERAGATVLVVSIADSGRARLQLARGRRHRVGHGRRRLRREPADLGLDPPGRVSCRPST